MKCKCGNVSRFEVYRLELRRFVFSSFGEAPVLESQRVVQTFPPIAIVCIKCGAKGIPEDFDYSKGYKSILDRESREEVPRVIAIEVEVEFSPE